jgi:hypothetical protein
MNKKYNTAVQPTLTTKNKVISCCRIITATFNDTTNDVDIKHDEAWNVLVLPCSSTALM